MVTSLKATAREIKHSRPHEKEGQREVELEGWVTSIVSGAPAHELPARQRTYEVVGRVIVRAHVAAVGGCGIEHYGGRE